MDQAIFDFFHFTLANDFFDWLLPFWRKRETWIPLYLFLVIFMLWRDWRKGLRVLLAVGVAVLLADFITSSILKPWIGRIRPCATVELQSQIRELVSCGGSLSFPSSHASNHLAIALVLWGTWFLGLPRVGYLLLVWAVSISLAQIYVAKHWPTDILGGWIVGALVAWLVVLAYNRSIKSGRPTQ